METEVHWLWVAIWFAIGLSGSAYIMADDDLSEDWEGRLLLLSWAWPLLPLALPGIIIFVVVRSRRRKARQRERDARELERQSREAARRQT